MRNRFVVFAGLALIPFSVKAQPRLPDGHPDLQGTYDLATLTPLERAAGTNAVLTREEAAKLEKEPRPSATRPMKRSKAIGLLLPKVATDPRPGGRSRRLQQFLARSWFAIHRGGRTNSRVDCGRSAQRPRAAVERGRSQANAGRSRKTNLGRSGKPRSGPGARGSYDNPEQRPLGERCLLGFGSTSGPPALPDYFYNNLHQIVQTPDSVMILTEMVHDARIVRMNAQHLPKAIRKWMGDSVGHWEGDTLVVDTTNFNDQTRFRGSTENLHVVERFSRIDPERCCIDSQWKIRRHGIDPGPANTPGPPPTNRFTNTPATKRITRSKIF